MKTKKFKSYLDIMDVDEEFKIYKNICKGKSKEIKYYIQWRDHILEKISGSSYERIYNFKRLCLNRSRPIKISIEFYLQICFAFIAVYVPSAIVDISYKPIFIVLTFFVISFILGKNVLEDNIKKSFYEDIIEIIDDFQMNKGVDLRCQTLTPNKTTKTP